MALATPCLARPYKTVVTSKFIHNDVAFDSQPGRRGGGAGLRRFLAALADQVRAFEAAHRADAAEPGDQLHGAVRAFAVAGAALGPEVAGGGGGIHHGLAGRDIELDPRRLDRYA